MYREEGVVTSWPIYTPLNNAPIKFSNYCLLPVLAWLSRYHPVLPQLRSELEVFGVQVSSVRLQSSYVASLSVTFEAILSSPPEQQSSALASFNTYLSGMFLTFAGYQVREGSHGLMGISSARKFHIRKTFNPPWVTVHVGQYYSLFLALLIKYDVGFVWYLALDSQLEYAACMCGK